MMRSDCYSADSDKKNSDINLPIHIPNKDSNTIFLPRTIFDGYTQLAQDKANNIHDSNKSELKLVSTFCIHK
jgi:hypothetical protein